MLTVVLQLLVIALCLGVSFFVIGAAPVDVRVKQGVVEAPSPSVTKMERLEPAPFDGMPEVREPRTRNRM
jgi:hypothetical protein